MTRRRQPQRRDRVGPLVVGCLLFAGSLALALSLWWQYRPVPAFTPVAGEPLLHADNLTSPAKAKRATTTPADGPEAPQPPAAPIALLKTAAPIEARPAVSSQSIGAPSRSGPNTSSSSSRTTTTPSTANAPFSIVLTGSDDALADLAVALAEGLNRRGLNAKVASLDDAGRPDALLVLGLRHDGPAEVWYCDPGPPAGAQLAGRLSDATRSLRPPSASSPDADGPDGPFPCDEAQAGRARSAVALLELPPDLIARPDLEDRAVDSVSQAVGRYFAENAAAIRSARTPRLVWPASGPITSPYGPAHPLGIDIGEWAGNIVAATDGTVVFAGGDPCCNYGRYVVIDSPDGVRTLYAHFQTIAVKKGQRVRQSQALGVVGCTGHCTGNHLHFEVIDNGVRKNPLSYLP